MRWLVIAMIAACGGVVAPPPPGGRATHALGPIHAIPGEGMEYRVRLRGLQVGLVQVGVGRVGQVDGREAIIVRSRGTSAGMLAVFSSLTWELTTTLDVQHGLPITSIEETTVVALGEHEHERTSHTWSPGDDRHDLHSAAAVLRGWKLPAGAHAQLSVEIGGAHIPVDVWEAGHEYLAAAKARAVRYAGIAFGKFAFAVWISDDAARVPLAVTADTKWGLITVVLVEYDPVREGVSSDG
jgi:hypothetical protein